MANNNNNFVVSITHSKQLDQGNEIQINKHSPLASIPESYEIIMQMAGLLTYSRLFCLPSPLSFRDSEKWLRFEHRFRAYSCGTVTELHRIPF
jgi:hypothetical protein